MDRLRTQRLQLGILLLKMIRLLRDLLMWQVLSPRDYKRAAGRRCQ